MAAILRAYGTGTGNIVVAHNRGHDKVRVRVIVGTVHHLSKYRVRPGDQDQDVNVLDAGPQTIDEVLDTGDQLELVADPPESRIDRGPMQLSKPDA